MSDSRKKLEADAENQVKEMFERALKNSTLTPDQIQQIASECKTTPEAVRKAEVKIHEMIKNENDELFANQPKTGGRPGLF